MRCKNCGAYNDDNRYICEICGSPLYDEEEIDTSVKEDSHTQTFSTVTNPVPQNDNTENKYTQPPQNKDNNNSDGKTPAEKKSIIVIAILAVVLIAIIASVIVVAQSKSKDADETTSSTTTSQSTTERTTEWTTQPTTEKTTTEAPTTTTTTTTVITWYINAGSSGGGTVSGEGEYKNGDKVTLTATADSGYVFDGWYSSGVKVSSSAKYTFTANENASFSAVFNPVETQDSSIDENEINFGD